MPILASLLVDPVCPAIPRVPTLVVGMPALPSDPENITIMLLASCVVMVCDGLVEVPVVLVFARSPMLPTVPVNSTTPTSKTLVADIVTVNVEIEGQFRATIKFMPMLAPFA
jgi:hypothetical protein